MGMFPPACRAFAVAALSLASCGGDAPGLTREPEPVSVGDDALPDASILFPRDAAVPGLPIGERDGSADVSRADAGQAPELDAASPSGCGGLAGLPCPDGDFCSHEGGPDQLGCGFADSLGSCQKKPQACTRESNPACGCDGISYANPCAAHTAGVSVEALGPCKADRALNCDERDVLCKKARPDCPDQQVPAVVDGCWGECQPVGACVCHAADECPMRESYVCHMSAQHCGPYVN